MNDPRTLAPAAPPNASKRGRQLPRLWPFGEVTRELRAASVKPATILRDGNRAKLIAEFFDRVEPTPPSAVTLPKVEKFVAWRIARGAKPRMVWGDVSLLWGVAEMVRRTP